MAQSVWMEPVKLQPYEISREMYVPFIFRYKLAPGLIRMIVVVGIGAVVSFLINPLAPIGFLSGGALLIALVMAARRSAVVKAYDSPMNRAAFERRYVEFDDSEIRLRTERNARSFVPYGCLAKVEEFEDRFLIFVTAGQFWMIPKTVFPDVQTMAEFRESARKNNLFN